MRERDYQKHFCFNYIYITFIPETKNTRFKLDNLFIN